MRGEVYSQSVSIVSKAAYFYYVRGMKRAEIAEELGLSPATISRLLHRAEDEGIVRFEITEPYLSCCEMEGVFLDHFPLQSVVVVPVKEEDYGDCDKVKRQVALEGARYVQRTIRDGDIIGLNWGGTMYHLIQYLNPCRKVPASIVTMHGGIDTCDPKFEAESLVRRASMAFGGKTMILTHGGLCSSLEEYEDLSRQPFFKKFQEMVHRIDISVSGVGSLYPDMKSPIVSTDYLNAEELAQVKEQKAVSDFLLRFLDKDGRECETSMKDRTLSISLDDYRKIPKRIVVASGEEKAISVMALLKGDLVDVLILDRNLAQAVLAGIEG